MQHKQKSLLGNLETLGNVPKMPEKGKISKFVKKNRGGLWYILHNFHKVYMCIFTKLMLKRN